jgi:predicted NAD/FAD-binding protein
MLFQPLSTEGYSSQLDDISACSSVSRALESSCAEGQTVYQQRQPQQPLFHPPAMSKRTAKKAIQQARNTSYAIAQVSLRALHTDEFDTFGTTVASKLRMMSDIQGHIAERIISNVLFRGVMNELSTHDAVAPVMPATLPSQEPSIVQCASPP